MKKIILSGLLMFSILAVASVEETECFKGNKKMCDKFLFSLVQKQDFSTFMTAQTKMCGDKNLHFTCKEIPAKDMKKFAAQDPKGSFYRFDQKPDIAFYITPML